LLVNSSIEFIEVVGEFFSIFRSLRLST